MTNRDDRIIAGAVVGGLVGSPLGPLGIAVGSIVGALIADQTD